MYRLNPAANAAMLAAALNNLSVDLGTSKSLVEACAAGRDAVNLSRELFKADAKTHRQLLLATLKNLQTSLESSGQTSEAKIVRDERRQLEAATAA